MNNYHKTVAAGVQGQAVATPSEPTSCKPHPVWRLSLNCSMCGGVHSHGGGYAGGADDPVVHPMALAVCRPCFTRMTHDPEFKLQTDKRGNLIRFTAYTQILATELKLPIREIYIARRELNYQGGPYPYAELAIALDRPLEAVISDFREIIL